VSVLSRLAGVYFVAVLVVYNGFFLLSCLCGCGSFCFRLCSCSLFCSDSLSFQIFDLRLLLLDQSRVFVSHLLCVCNLVVIICRCCFSLIDSCLQIYGFSLVLLLHAFQFSLLLLILLAETCYLLDGIHILLKALSVVIIHLLCVFSLREKIGQIVRIYHHLEPCVASAFLIKVLDTFLHSLVLFIFRVLRFLKI